MIARPLVARLADGAGHTFRHVDGRDPNVVFSCGALIQAGNLILPFAMADTATTFAEFPLQGLLAAMS